MIREVTSDFGMSRRGLIFSSASARAAAGAYIGNWLRFRRIPARPEVWQLQSRRCDGGRFSGMKV